MNSVEPYFILQVLINWLQFGAIIVVRFPGASGYTADYGIPRPQMDMWSSKFGSPLYNSAQSISKYNELHGRFQNSRDSTVAAVDSNEVLNKILTSFKTSFGEKVDVLTKAAGWAEERAKDYYMNGRAPTPFNYVNSKRVNDEVEVEKNSPIWKYPLELDLKIDRHFSNWLGVNTSTSTLHVPTTTYELDPTLMSCVNWTSDMDIRFIINFREHPTLNWQYFCSASGLLRQFPGFSGRNDGHSLLKDSVDSRVQTRDLPPPHIDLGIKWPFGMSTNLLENQFVLDVYDCRMRPWYIGAASSYKSIVILIDTSGSMTGLRNKIARHVAFTILETLTDNDKMAVIKFTNDTSPVVSCFEHKFVEATPENVRSVKQALTEQRPPEKFVNLTYVIGRAFDMFEQQSAACNKAIFLVTDGSPANNQEIIKAKQNTTNKIRLFTYLIGREAQDAVNVQHMACNNNGYFSHLSTLSQVQEQVLKYIPVMSRPIVYSVTRDVSWTPIYTSQIVQPHIIPAKSQSNDNQNQSKEFEYMISASLAVHETHNPKNSTQKEATVQFLGVVGTDIPLRELHILSDPFSIGSNGYTFIITNNGHVVMHPRWTPHIPKSDDHAYDILKPNYQAMDIGEIELVDAEGLWRNNDSQIMKVRQEMLLNYNGNEQQIKIKIPQDDFRRVTIRTQNYEYSRIPHTPYTLAVAVQYKMNRFIGRTPLDDEAGDFSTILETSPGPDSDQSMSNDIIVSDGKLSWLLNPTWLYCEYLQSEVLEQFRGSKELELVHILKMLVQENSDRDQVWRWLKDGDFGSVTNSTSKKIRCNKELVESFVFDANVTEVFKSNKLWNFGDKDSKLIEKYGVVKAFITTRSGLTRWISLGEDDDEIDANVTMQVLSEFSQVNSIYYQRAIDQYSTDPNSFVYTISSSNPNLLVATRAVYTNRGGLFAPVAVVGLQFNQQILADVFFNVTNTNCITGDKKNCKYSCKSSEFDCFVLDDNGYIVVAENSADNGKLFSEAHSVAMEGLVTANIYRRVEIYDYQSICFAANPLTEKTSLGNVFGTPFTHVQNIWSWFIAKLSLVVLNFIGHGVFGQEAELNSSDSDEFSPSGGLLEPKESLYNYEKIVLCDMKYNLFTYGSRYNSVNFTHTDTLPECGHNCVGSYSTHFIPHTNLILVITDGKCSCTSYIEEDEVKTRGERFDYSNNCPPRAAYENRPPEQCIDLNADTNKEKSSNQECGKAAKMNAVTPSIIILLSLLMLCMSIIPYHI